MVVATSPRRSGTRSISAGMQITTRLRRERSLAQSRGNKWLLGQGWKIKDQYRNTSRDEMPQGETITSFGARLVALAQTNIARLGGSKTAVNGRAAYRIPLEPPANVEPLPDPARQHA